MSVCCHVWKNCNYFNLCAQTVLYVKTQRNIIAHSQTLTLTQRQTDDVFDCLNDLVKDKDIQGINQQECIRELANIRKGNDTISNLRQLKDDTNDIRENVRKVIIILNEQQEERRKQLEEKTRQQNESNKILRDRVKVYVGFILLCVFPLCLGYISHQISDIGVEVRTFNDCISEQFNAPFYQDFPLLGYLENHKIFVGREWLFKDIRTALENGSEKALILSAEMGYGKSAVFKQIICASKDESALWLKERVVAFHVCRFDVKSTRSAARFVYRLAAFLITRLPGFKEVFDSEVPQCGLIFETFRCEDDIEACFDQAILMPLSKMQTRDMKIVLLDAMDECVDYHTNANVVFELISRRLWKLPEWLKWVMFSRDIPLEKNHEHQFLRRKLVLNDSQNAHDIEQYLKLSIKNADEYPKPPTFLLATMITESTKKSFNESIKIEEIYEYNFNHLFERGAQYATAKCILELIIASTDPISINDIENILQRIKNKMAVNDAVARLKSVVSTNDNKLCFIHQSFFDWLSCNRSRVYQVNKTHGHLLLAVHLFSQAPPPLVNLSIHVALSEDLKLQERFRQMDVRNVKNERYPLHSLARKHHSPEALSLLLTHFPNVHILDENYETVAFIAAAQGHVDQLGFLHTKGEVLSFRKEISTKTMELENKCNYEWFHCKTGHILLPGYNLLHVAIHNGRFEIVKYLLENVNQTVLKARTGTGLTALELACTRCDLDDYKIIKQYYADIGGCAYFAATKNCLNMFQYFQQENLIFDCITEQNASPAPDDASVNLIGDHLTGYNLQVFLNFNISILHVAIMNGSVETARFLIENYPNLMECQNAFGITPMLWSVLLNKTELFQLMIYRVNMDRCGRLSDMAMSLIIEADVTYLNFLQLTPCMSLFLCPTDWTFNELAIALNRHDLIELVMKQNLPNRVIKHILTDTDILKVKLMDDHINNFKASNVFKHMLEESLEYEKRLKAIKWYGKQILPTSAINHKQTATDYVIPKSMDDHINNIKADSNVIKRMLKVILEKEAHLKAIKGYGK